MSAHRHSDIVLAVDDSAESLHKLTAALERQGHTVLVAVDGLAALAIVEQITPDIVLLDAIMPGMDGFQTCRRLKERSGLADVPVIFMTGLSETEHVVRGLAAGGVDYIAKPVAPDELIARMRVHLGNARVARSQRAALDTAGRHLLAVDEGGRLRWCTPQAARLLEGVMSHGRAEPEMLPEDARHWLAAVVAGRGTDAVALGQTGAPALRLHFVSRLPDGDFLLRLSVARATDDRASMREIYALTGREAEVLTWIARGKANRDIGEILGLSPRAVNKHLEQVFRKLGVENRTSAATLALRTMEHGGEA